MRTCLSCGREIAKNWRCHTCVKAGLGTPPPRGPIRVQLCALRPSGVGYVMSARSLPAVWQWLSVHVRRRAGRGRQWVERTGEPATRPEFKR